jgi:hypothetical protein
VAVRVTVEVTVATVARAKRALVLTATAGDTDARQRRGRGGLWGLRHGDPIFTQLNNKLTKPKICEISHIFSRNFDNCQFVSPKSDQK